MENLALISIIGLFIAILLGFLRNVNVGIISIAIAYLIAIIFKLPVGDVIKGFSSSLFITMLGVTYLFSIVNANNTLPIVAKIIVKRVGTKTWLLPIVLWVIGFILSFIGPGAIPGLAIMPMIAIPIALQSGYNPIMLSVIAVSGTMAARMSPITPEGVLVHELLAGQGIIGAEISVFICMALAGLVNGLAAFLVYKGWKVKGKISTEAHSIEEKLSRNQILSLFSLFILVIGALGFKFNVGLLSFVLGSALIVIGVAEEKKVISGVPWNVLLMVVGVGMLMKILLQSGGIDILVNFLSSLMRERTAAPIMLVAGGIMSFFSSGLGVVFPTLIPTVSGIVDNVGGMTNAVEIASMVVIGGTVAGFTPISTTGALILAGISANEDAKNRYPENKMFAELFGWSFVMLLISIIISLLGIYNFIAWNF